MGESKTDVPRYILISRLYFCGAKINVTRRARAILSATELSLRSYVHVSQVLTIYSFTGGLLSYFRNLLGSREMRILILGLDGAGKTTILYRFA